MESEGMWVAKDKQLRRKTETDLAGCQWDNECQIWPPFPSSHATRQQLSVIYLTLVCALLIPVSIFSAFHAGCKLWWSMHTKPGLELSGKHFLWLEAVVWHFFVQIYVVQVVSWWPKSSKLYSVSLIFDQLKVLWEERNTKICKRFSSTIAIMRKEIWMETSPTVIMSNGLWGKPSDVHCGYTVPFLRA